MYEDASSRNGKRVLVDRLWPRGMRKERGPPGRMAPRRDAVGGPAPLAPPQPGALREFGDRYIGELEDADHRPAVQHLRDLAARDKVTLHTATKDVGPSEAAVLAQRLGAAGTAGRQIRRSVIRRTWRTARQQVLTRRTFAFPGVDAGGARLIFELPPQRSPYTPPRTPPCTSSV
ncbi:DUF488 domain-containing protein [Streptomyces sp. NPDC001123]